MARRTYDQYCGLATSLDLLGERWSMLLLRNLLVGPQRFSDLLAGMPGLGTTLLATRLRQLEEAGVVRRAVLPPPASSAVYELTDHGRELEPMLLALARWGTSHLPSPASLHYDARSMIVGLWSRLDASVEGLDGAYAVTLDGLDFGVTVADHEARVAAGLPHAPRCHVTASAKTFAELVAGEVSLPRALQKGLIEIGGDAEAAMAFAAACGVGEPLAGAAR